MSTVKIADTKLTHSRTRSSGKMRGMSIDSYEEPRPFMGPASASTPKNGSSSLFSSKRSNKSSIYSLNVSDGVPEYKVVATDVPDQFRPTPVTDLQEVVKPVSYRNRQAQKGALRKHASTKYDKMVNGYQTRVSFDTVNLQIADDVSDSESDSDDEYSINSDFYKTGGWGPSTGRPPAPSPARGRSVSPMRSSRSLSPSVGSPERSFSPSSRSMSPRGRPARMISPGRAYRRDYPTSPIITHDACTLTKVHKDFDSLYEGAVTDKKVPLPNRTVMVYISGRHHTWVALDWAVRKLLEDGDTLVVIASVSPSRKSRRRRSMGSRSQSRTRNVIPSKLSESELRNSPDYVKVLADNVMKYILAIMSSNLIIKITIELSVGHTKDVLKDMYQLYLPGLVVCSALPPKSYALRSWKTSRITDRLVKNFPIPLIIVPATNMGAFEMKLFSHLKKKMSNYDTYDSDADPEFNFDSLDENKVAFSILRHFIGDKKSEDLNSEEEDSDVESIESVESFVGENDSIKAVYETVQAAETKLQADLSHIKQRGLDKDTFKDKLAAISEAGYMIGMTMAETAKLGGAGADLVRSITDAPDMSVMSKKKSMLLDDPPTINIQGSPSLSPTRPRVSPNASYAGVSSAQRTHTSLKFQEPQLLKTYSRGEYPSIDSKTSSKPSLRATKSHSSVPSPSQQPPKKEKKSFFRGLFGKK